MTVLRHGTTRQRAERIVAKGPDRIFMEPGAVHCAGAFCACLTQGPFPLGKPEDYARHKARLFPDEGGAAIVEFDVPEDVLALATDPVVLPLSNGFVEFDEDHGLPELCRMWAGLGKQIVPVSEDKS